jgi:hypothetical protein
MGLGAIKGAFSVAKAITGVPVLLLELSPSWSFWQLYTIGYAL